MTQATVKSPELEKILKRLCPNTKHEETTNGISWAKKCAEEYLDDVEKRNSYTTKVETSTAGIGVGLGLPFAFRWLKELSIFR